MTKRKPQLHKNDTVTLLISALLFCLLLSCAVFLSSELGDMVRGALSFAVSTVIPAIFPYVLLTDFAVRFIHFERIEPIRQAFERIFKINGVALSAFVAGMLGGFPVGAHRAITLYKDGKISKEECERLMGFANNPSPAYTVCAVGVGVFGSIRIGVILYFITIASAVLTGALFGTNKNYTENINFNSEQKYSFVSSVKAATAISLNVCAFTSAFSLIVGGVLLVFGDSLTSCLILPFAEIGNAVLFLSKSKAASFTVKLVAAAFSLSFSGLSVLMQSAALATEANLSMKEYMKCKLVAGAVSVILSLFVFRSVDFFISLC